MAVLSVKTVLPNGIEPNFAPASVGGDSFPNDGRTYLHVKNASVADINVTVDSFTPCNHGFDHDLVISIPAGEERLIGTFATNRFNNEQSMVNVNYSMSVDVSVAALRY